MELFEETTPFFWALTILIAASVFTVSWTLDALTHKELAHVDITDRELQTHRNILAASMVMEISLVGMYWFPLAMLPILIGSGITRFSQEFIDELHYHADRCTPYESRLHLVMWISVWTKAAAMFIWGFFTKFEGLHELPVILYVWGGLLLVVMGYISMKEWNR